MHGNNPYSTSQSAYEPLFSETYLPDEQYELFNLSMSDDRLQKMLIDSLNENVAYWNQKPWMLDKTDKDNVNFLLGDQLNDVEFLINDAKYVDNRMFASVRAILSYATGQLAVPEVTPSKGDKIYLKGARDLQSALFQHAADEKVDSKTRAAVLNLITRKRGYLKLRWDPNAGMFGDVVTEVCNPEDIIIDRNAPYLGNPNVIYHRVRCTVDELISRFPKKTNDIKVAYSIKQGRFTQMSRFVTYFEAWFTYMDKNAPKEGVAWFVPDHNLILDKMPNPNWVYTGDDKKDKIANVMSRPPKPFIAFNYLNLGHSFIDETCLFEQAKPMQEMLNRRGRQIWENADYVNGRWVASKKSFSAEDAYKLVNKGAKTIALADADDVSKSLVNVASAELPAYVYNTLLDSRGEIDVMMGTPAQFRGAQPQGQDTLGRDLMVKQQAGMLQDDLVKAISSGMEEYYKVLLQTMRVYYTDDYWFQCKGADGKYEFIMLNGETLDTNVKVGVQVDSTLPVDKQQIRSIALELLKQNKIDYRTAMEDLGLPNPEIRAERFMKSQLDPAGYTKSIELSQINTEAESDIMLLKMGKVPDERDEYDEDYLNYFNKFVSSNRFSKMQGEKTEQNPDGDPENAQRILAFLMAVQQVANDSANLQELTLDAAEMIPTPPPQPPMGAAPGESTNGLPPVPGSPQGAPPVDTGVTPATPPVPTQ
jgi:hypothetical protein